MRPSADTDPWGVVTRFYDALGRLHEVPDTTRDAIHAAMGVDPTQPIAAPGVVRVAQAGQARALGETLELILEDGTNLGMRDALPPDLPIGYHRLRNPELGSEQLLIVSPLRCHLPERLRTWGWAVQSYATRSQASWGLGDLGDVARLARWSATECGAGFLLLNPLYAATPLVPQQPSPYSPSSRLFHNLLALDIDSVPGADALDAGVGDLRTAGRALNAERLIDHDAVFRLKLAALERLWQRFGAAPAFERYRHEMRATLPRFAGFCVLAETYGPAWAAWPVELRHPDSPAVARFAAAHPERVAFHEWIQWLLDDQLRGVGREIALMTDLPVGFDPDGADAWAWQDALALRARVGAPPDDFNANGQNWGLPPFAPHRLTAAGYLPFIQTLRAALRHARALRIDHVMGLFRLYWIPLGVGAAQGTYVRYPAEHLLAITAVESHRAKAVIVGEDLGTVEPGVREELFACGMPSYRLLWFEPTAPRDYPPQSVAAVTTHDLPTIAGVWSAEEGAMQRSVGLEPHDATLSDMRARLATAATASEQAPVDEVIVRVHETLAQAPSQLATATLEDALAVREPPNRPGTWREWPNWSLALPQTLEELERHPLARDVAAALTRHRTTADFD